MELAERNMDIVKNIQEQLKYVSKLLSSALSLSAVSLLSFSIGRQAFEVMNVKLSFAWAALLTYIIVFVLYLLVASALVTISNSISALFGSNKENERQKCELAYALITMPILFNPFSILGGHPELEAKRFFEDAHGPYLMLVLTGVAPLALLVVFMWFTLPELLELVDIHKYLDGVVKNLVGMLLFYGAIGCYLYYLLYASMMPYMLVTHVSTRLWYFIAPAVMFAIYVAAKLVIGTIELAISAFQWLSAAIPQYL